MNLEAIVPIKFTSERVPGKNFRLFGNKPLFLHIIDTLKDIPSIANIIVNTDAPIEVFEGHLNHPKITFSVRPNELCGDFVSMNEIIDYEVNRSEFEIFFMTHTTNPLLSKNTIQCLIDEYDKLGDDFDSVMAVTPFFGRFFDIFGKPINHELSSLLRTQDLNPLYFENSCGYVFSKKSFLTSKSRIGLSPKMVTTPKLESIDIDDEDDWQVASAVARRDLIS